MLWARLSVFAGGFELDAVEAVCTGEYLPADDVVDVLAGLVDKSIIDRDDTPDGWAARYRMLATLQDYGSSGCRRRKVDAAAGPSPGLFGSDRRASAEWISDRQV